MYYQDRFLSPAQIYCLFLVLNCQTKAIFPTVLVHYTALNLVSIRLILLRNPMYSYPLFSRKENSSPDFNYSIVRFICNGVRMSDFFPEIHYKHNNSQGSRHKIRLA